MKMWPIFFLCVCWLARRSNNAFIQPLVDFSGKPIEPDLANVTTSMMENTKGGSDVTQPRVALKQPSNATMAEKSGVMGSKETSNDEDVESDKVKKKTGNNLSDVKKLIEENSLTDEIKKKTHTLVMTADDKMSTEKGGTNPKTESKQPTCNRSDCDPMCINLFLMIFTVYYYYTVD